MGDKGGPAFTTVGGNCSHGYKYNSQVQRSALANMKEVIEKAIREHFDPSCCYGGAVTIVDLGCSVGPNTFLFVETIIDAIKDKINVHESPHQDLTAPEICNKEYMVLFNDMVGNDFNTLFQDLPPNRAYFAMATPGSFHGRLFPRASVHYFSSTTAIHYMSRPPVGVVNKGRVHVPGGGSLVLEAYSSQFRTDMASFLKARSEELVSGGIMSLGFICRPVSANTESPYFGFDLRILEAILNQLVLEGIVEEKDLDTFQVPLYPPNIPEFRDIVLNNGCFDILVEHTYFYSDELPSNASEDDWLTNILPKVADSYAAILRAIFQVILTSHFGEAIVEEVFKRMPSEVSRIYRKDTKGPISSRTQGALFVLKRK